VSDAPAAAPAPGIDPLAGLAELVREDMERVNHTIVERMQSPVALIPQLAGHIVAAGGKRLRPLLTLATARMCGYTGADDHVKLATAIEFLHTATLLHDDVVDESDLRRGRATANALWGNQASVLVGDFLFSRAFQLMVEVGVIPVLATLSHASAVIAEGEVHQLLTTNDPDTTEDAYLEVIRGKTAALFAAACKIGGELAGRPDDEVAALHTYGMDLGIAFQLVDDALDYSAEQAKLGKTIGDDFREGKMTLPVILAMARGGAADRDFWVRCIAREEQAEDGTDLRHALDLMARHRAIEDTLARARDVVAEARAALAPFPDDPIREALARVADFVVERVY